ncbi:hypothetical protein APHAL10511_004915 [Amanita phalloides]|nr:hypothetical protein APHAL10511_004915 [Amanita phalloides]
MAGLEGLASIVYHEKQQPGSALCAQHALNNLLQGNYFSAPDLADIAANLDLLERSYRSGSENESLSMNMDDSGFFSIQVMENALKVWGLNLVRWRSEEMSSYQDRPYIHLAFILNLQQHWFTLRRFGNAETSAGRDPGDGHWLNLNSFLKSPAWVGRLYLSMVLEQAEEEGYSVFVVVQDDPSAALALPRTDADMIAVTLPQPSGISSSASDRDKGASEIPEEFDEEDFELQAALQASLARHPHYNEYIGPSWHTTLANDSTSGASPHASESENMDPVAASMERNRLMLQRMRQQQEFAQQEAWSYSTEGMTPEQVAVHDARREARNREEEEERENLRRAIAESEAMARPVSHAGDDAGPSVPHGQTRVAYDDDDADFQAALRASLQQVNGSDHVDDGPSIPSDDANTEALSIEEIRKKRLAKFGG